MSFNAYRVSRALLATILGLAFVGILALSPLRRMGYIKLPEIGILGILALAAVAGACGSLAIHFLAQFLAQFVVGELSATDTQRRVPENLPRNPPGIGIEDQPPRKGEMGEHDERW